MEFSFCVHVTLVKKLKHVQLPTIQHLELGRKVKSANMFISVMVFCCNSNI